MKPPTNEHAVFDRHFSRVVVISLPHASERADRALRELAERGLSSNAVVIRAVDGRLSPPTDWWPSGPGAWGCMQSHYRVVQDAILDGIESLLVIEDDCIWQKGAAAMAEEFMAQVPDDWGQIYFGGQHRDATRPERVKDKPAVQRARRVHRTHAYAIHRRAMAQFLKHIVYAPDYIDAAKAKVPHKRHIDHQLEVAHQRGDWKVYCPSFWLAGQGENKSDINGKTWPAAWWHLSWRENYRRLPVVICDRPLTTVEMKFLHFGRHIDATDPTIDVGVRDSSGAADLCGIFEKIASEAYGKQVLPAMHGGWPEKAEWLRSMWSVPLLLLSESPDLEALCDYPGSKIVRHDWFNPATPRRVAVAEEDATDSTMATERREAVPCVHQVWIGGAEMPPRLAAYCETIRKAFPGWDYKLWREEDMEALAQGAVMPEVVKNATLPIGMRADVIRLEILRQHGGVYFDTDFEALRGDLRPLFPVTGAFYYGDELSGRPSNAFMAALANGHPFVDLMLRRIAAQWRIPENVWETVSLTGPGRLADTLNFWVGDWNSHKPVMDGEQRLGSSYGAGSVVGLWKECCYPYHYQEGTWATFKTEDFPAAWAAHHWEGGWHREPQTR